MKKIRLGCWVITLGIMLWSIITDISTYNVYFQTDKNIVLYCIDGIIFNFPKMLLPIVISATTYIYDLIVAKYENRLN